MLGRGMEIFIWGIERKIYKGKGMHGAELVKASCLTISITAYRSAKIRKLYISAKSKLWATGFMKRRDYETSSENIMG